MKIRPEGGPPQPIAELRGFQSADWGSQGDILFRAANRDPLYVIHESGGSPREATQLNVDLAENSHRHPEFLPDGRRFLFTSRSAERDNNALYVASLDSPEVRRLMPAESQVSHVPTRGDRSGALFYYGEGALVARSFDADSETLIGEAIPVAEGVSYNAPSINADFRVSQDGSVIIIQRAGGREAQLTWFRRDGEEIGTVGPLGQPDFPRISPNGETVLFATPDPRNGNRDVWHTELARGITTKLTTHIANDFVPVWSPDGSQILFVSDRDGEGGVYLKTSLDPGVGEALIPGLERRRPSDWSLDGRWILSELGLPNNEDIWVASLSGGVDAFPFLETPFREANGRFSPDGRWIAYVSNETGQREVHVRPFEGEPAGTDRDGQAIRDSPNWAFATRSRTSRPPAIPRTCSCRPYIGWRLSSSAGSSEPSKEGSPANTSPTIWTSSPFASTDAHPGLAACCSTACLSRLFSVLPRQLRPFTSAPDVGNGPQSPGNHYILGSVDLREYPLEDIWVASLSGGVDAFPFLETPFREANGRFSPDGRWIAYVSNETGQREVHVRPFEGEPAGTEGRIQISSDGGVSPVWGPEGRELFYMSEDVLYAVDTADLGGQASVSLPSRLFQACPDGRPMGFASVLPNVASYHTLDGERFLISCQQEVSQFVVLLDWMFPE